MATIRLGNAFHLYDVLHDFSHDLIIDLTAVLKSEAKRS